MSMYGEDWSYASSRLSETIVRLKGEPVYIYSVHSGMSAKYAKLSDLDNIAFCHVDELDLKPVPLGYCNYNKTACYLARIPMRRDWRQGLRRGNFTSLSGVDAERIPYESLRKTILGEYPTYTASLDAVRKVKSMAWHRHWAVDNDLQVFHKGAVRPVGQVVNGVVELTSRSLYLAEALSESV